MKAVLPQNETIRIQALRQYKILDTPPEAAFDDLTRLAAKICGTPIALRDFQRIKYTNANNDNHSIGGRKRLPTATSSFPFCSKFNDD
jgi:hypothetical protein